MGETRDFGMLEQAQAAQIAALESQLAELTADLRTANETIALVTMQRDSWMNEAKRLALPPLPYRPPSPQFAKLLADTRECTCHPSEAPNPCPRQYAYTECLAAMAREPSRSIVLYNPFKGPVSYDVAQDGTLTATPRPFVYSDEIARTPGPDPETPRTSDAESAAGLSGEKPDAGHPAGGRAMPLRALLGGDGVFRG